MDPRDREKPSWSPEPGWHIYMFVNRLINIGDSPIAPSMEPPRNLGVLFDSTCCLNDHVNKICKNINYQLYSIGKIWKYLDKPTTEKMINSAVASCLDYCNSLLYGINGYLVSQLQCCQNNAARIVSLRRKYDHITPVLKYLHWLPVEYRMNYKILLLAYKAQHGMAPPYLSSLLSPYKLGRSLQSLDDTSLSPGRFWQALFCACRPFSLEHAPHVHQVCPVHWHFQEQSEDTSV